jgi:hypothetical protein
MGVLMTTTPLMNLVLPDTLVTEGPEYADEVNEALTTLDSHDHSEDSGKKIPTAGINIDENLPFNGKGLLTADFLNLITGTAFGDIVSRAVYESNGDIFWKNSSGAAVQITSGGSLAVPGSGAITGKDVTAPYTILSGDAQKVILVTGGGAITLPAATNNMFVGIKDKNGVAQTTNIDVTPNGLDAIEGVNAVYAVNSNFGAVWLVSDGVASWSIV